MDPTAEPWLPREDDEFVGEHGEPDVCEMGALEARREHRLGERDEAPVGGEVAVVEDDGDVRPETKRLPEVVGSLGGGVPSRRGVVGYDKPCGSVAMPEDPREWLIDGDDGGGLRYQMALTPSQEQPRSSGQAGCRPGVSEDLMRVVDDRCSP